MTVLDYLSDRYRHSNETDWRERLEKGQVFLDGVPAYASAVLRAGQELAWRRPPWEEPDVPLSYAVLYKDEEVLAVAKPRGLPTLPAGGFLEHTLLTLLRKAYPEATPVHRLGRGTSGLLLSALTGPARSGFAAMFRDGRVQKTYRALVSGVPEKPFFTVDVAIGPVPYAGLGTIMAACRAGKRALSRGRVLETRGDCSLVEVQILTGRPHQIRIHMAAAGHPLVGDPLYGPGGIPRNGGKAFPSDLGYWLHAERLSFKHPISGAPVDLHCFPRPHLRLRGGSL